MSEQPFVVAGVASGTTSLKRAMRLSGRIQREKEGDSRAVPNKTNQKRKVNKQVKTKVRLVSNIKLSNLFHCWYQGTRA